MESGYVTEIDTTLVSIKNKLHKMNHINPRPEAVRALRRARRKRRTSLS